MEVTMLEAKDFVISEENSGNSLICYYTFKETRIFNKKLGYLELWSSEDFDLLSNITEINEYLNWLNNCETVLRMRYQLEIGKEVSDSWFSKIEVYSVSLAFIAMYGYSADILCGDKCSNRDMEIIFDGRNVESITLLG